MRTPPSSLPCPYARSDWRSLTLCWYKCDIWNTASRLMVHHVYYWGGNSKSLVFVFWNEHLITKNIYLLITTTQLSDTEHTHITEHIIFLYLIFAKYNVLWNNQFTISDVLIFRSELAGNLLFLIIYSPRNIWENILLSLMNAVPITVRHMIY